VARLSRKERIATLRRFGLGPYEASAYLSLLDEGAATAGRISRSSGVPRGRIYEVLESLERRGLASVSPEKPARYSALAVSALLDAQAAKIEERRRDVARIRSAFAEADSGAAARQAEPGAAKVFVARGQKAVRERLRGILRDAKESIDIQLGSRALPGAWPDLERLPRRGAPAARRVRVLVASPRPGESKLLEKLAATALRRHLRVAEAMDVVSCAIADGSRLLMWNVAEETGGRGDFCVWTDDPGVVVGFAALFESGWTSAADPDAVLHRMSAGVARAGFILLRSAQETAERLLQSVQRAREEVLDLTSGTRLARRAEGLVPRNRLPAGIRVRGLTHVTKDNASNLRSLPDGFRVHHIPQELGLRFTVVDGRETYVYRPIAPGESVEDVFSDTLYSDDPQVARVYRNVFDSLWAQSVPLVERLRALDEGAEASETRVIRDLLTAFGTLAEAVSAEWRDCRVITIGPALAAGAPMFSASEEGRRVRIVLNIMPESLATVESLASRGVELRHLPFELGLRSVGLDRRATFIMQGATFQDAIAGADESLVMIHSTDPGFAEVQARLHEALWSLAVPWESRAQELREGRAALESGAARDPAKAAAKGGKA
jgi:sugar-specific transcriptional regulator TrmB